MHSYSKLIAPMKLFNNLFKKLFLQIKSFGKKHLGLVKPTATEALYSLQKSLTLEKKDLGGY